MKVFKFLAVILLVTILGITACSKEIKVEDYPALLLKADITPGEKDKEVAVFLYVTKPNIDYQLLVQGEKSKYLLLNLNNTLNNIKERKFNIEGLEELLEQVTLVQVIDEKNVKNPLITRFVFKLKDPLVKIKPVFQFQATKASKIKKMMEASKQANSAVVAAAAISKNFGNKAADDNVNGIVIGVLLFWLLIIIATIIYFMTKKAD